MTFINELPKEDRDRAIGAAVYSAIMTFDLQGFERGIVILLAGKSVDELVVATNIADSTNDDDRLRMIQALRNAVRQLEQQEPDRN